MSRRAIISDVHGNLVAFEAVLADIKLQGVQEIVCLGDIAGYGPQPVECIKLVREHSSWTLLGNHDEALFREPVDFSKNALDSILWQRTILEPKPDSPPEMTERWEWFKSLLPARTEGDILFVHASPRDPIYEYVLKEDFHNPNHPGSKAIEMFRSVDWLCFCGHSHRPGVVAEDYVWHPPSDYPDGTALLKRGFKTIVNIGSVGQPRDNNPAACYVIFDYEPPPEKAATSKADSESNTVVRTKVMREPPPDETRFGGEDLERARDTAMLKMPRVTFRRVQYNIAEAQTRFFAVPELPRHNALRLAQGV